MSITFTAQYLGEMQQIIEQIDQAQIEKIVAAVAAIRAAGGRLFFLGVGGSAGNASHAVNDFRKIAGVESYAPTDNVSEFTARANDEGWETTFAAWLQGSRLTAKDGIFVLSVGGGNLEKGISANLVRAVQYANEVGATVLGIVGRDGGFAAKAGTAVVIIPTVNAATVTPHSESFQAVVWHLIVSHPLIAAHATKWESTV